MLKCKKCSKELNFTEFVNGNFKKVLDVDLKKVGIFCKEHGEEIEEELKSERFVEEYKGNKIYCKDGKYIPYWECHYYYKSLKDVRNRIDNAYIAIVDIRMFRLINK